MITAEKLEEIADICKRCKEVMIELNSVYNTYASPRFDGYKRTSPGTDPTSKAFYRAEKLNEELEELLRIRADFEEELSQINKPEICAIIRWHYILGKSWKQTSERVFHTSSYFLARDRLRWYLTAPHQKPSESI